MRNQKAANKAKSWQATKFTYMGKKRESKPLVLDLCAPFFRFLHLHLRLGCGCFPQQNIRLEEVREIEEIARKVFLQSFDSGHGCFPADWEITVLPISQCYPKIKNVFFLRCSWISSMRLPSLVPKKSKASPKQSSAVFWLHFFSF